MKRVLAVSADRRLRRLAQLTLGRQGYAVLLAEDQYEAVDRAKAEQPDMIALDENTPEGAATREALRECLETRSIPVFQIPPRPW